MDELTLQDALTEFCRTTRLKLTLKQLAERTTEGLEGSQEKEIIEHLRQYKREVDEIENLRKEYRQYDKLELAISTAVDALRKIPKELVEQDLLHLMMPDDLRNCVQGPLDQAAQEIVGKLERTLVPFCDQMRERKRKLKEQGLVKTNEPVDIALRHLAARLSVVRKGPARHPVPEDVLFRQPVLDIQEVPLASDLCDHEIMNGVDVERFLLQQQRDGNCRTTAFLTYAEVGLLLAAAGHLSLGGELAMPRLKLQVEKKVQRMITKYRSDNKIIKTR